MIEVKTGGRNMSPRAVVAWFHKTLGRRFVLFSLTTIEDRKGHDGRSYRVRECYDVDLSRKYGYIFNMSGCGGDSEPVHVEGIYHVQGEIEVEEKPSTLYPKRLRKINHTQRLHKLPKEFNLLPGQDLLGWLEHNGIDSGSVWCSICKDRFPDDETCQHIWWCEVTCWWSTPSKRCRCKTLKRYSECREEYHAT